MPRSRAALLVCLVTAVSAASCSLQSSGQADDSLFEGDPAGGSAGTGGADDASVGRDAGSFPGADASLDGAGGAFDAGEPADAGDASASGDAPREAAISDAGGDHGCVLGADPCDADCDGVRATSCGGEDCCDVDPLVSPSQGAFFATADACGSFDYNCDGDEEQHWDFALTGCFLCFTFSDGFEDGPPACGVSGAFHACVDDGNGNLCKEDPGSRTQECR